MKKNVALVEEMMCGVVLLCYLFFSRCRELESYLEREIGAFMRSLRPFTRIHSVQKLSFVIGEVIYLAYAMKDQHMMGRNDLGRVSTHLPN